MQIALIYSILQEVIFIKFTGHWMIAYSWGLISFKCNRFTKICVLLPPKKFSIKHLLRLYKSLMLAFRGSQKLHILEFALNSTQTFIFLSMLVFSTIVKKGGDCKSKVLPPWVLDIVGQNSRGTNMFASMKQMVRFLKL